MSATRKFWIVTEAICILLGALIITTPLFTNAPTWAAIFGVPPVTVGLMGLGLWTIGGRGL